MDQKTLLELLDIVYDVDNKHTIEERLRAKLRLEEFIKTLVPE